MPRDFRKDENIYKRKCRMSRKIVAGHFRADYIHSDDVFDHKTCIRPEGTHSWHDKSCRIMWVGVHGKDTICVVTMTQDVDLSRVTCGPGHLVGCTKNAVLHDFRRLAVSEIEGQRECKNQVPFGVVSVTPRSNEVVKESGHEASSDDFEEKKALNIILEKFKSIEPPEKYDNERGKLFLERRNEVASKLKKIIEASSTFAVYDEKKAIEFLQEKMKSNVDFTVDHTIQTAILAFQHLLQKQFKAHEIEVSYLDPDYENTGWGYLFNTTDFIDLEIVDIERHLAAINGPIIPREQLAAESSKAGANVTKVGKSTDQDLKGKKEKAVSDESRVSTDQDLKGKKARAVSDESRKSTDLDLKGKKARAVSADESQKSNNKPRWK